MHGQGSDAVLSSENHCSMSPQGILLWEPSLSRQASTLPAPLARMQIPSLSFGSSQGLQIAKKFPLGWLPMPSKPLSSSWRLCVWCGREETVRLGALKTQAVRMSPDSRTKPFSDTSCKWQWRGFRDSLIVPLWGAMRWCEDIRERWSGETPKSKYLFLPLLLRLKVPRLLAMSHPASWLHFKMEREVDGPEHLNFRTPATEILPLKHPLYGLHTRQATI